MEEYIVKDGKKLRLGYTTGSCAAAAAKAAAYMLLTGREAPTVDLLTPKGIALTLPVLQTARGADFVSCAIRKDSGDDPDVTRDALIFARVQKTDAPGVTIDGGAGVGRVTKRGLDQPVGAAAINSVPRRMIEENVRAIMRLCEFSGGLSVVISVPEGEALAQKTFNPRLGITGGISILGTTGIVEPMSEQALVDTIRVELRQRRADGADYILLTPGNYGADYIRGAIGLDPKTAVLTSNFIGDALESCRELGFRGALLVGHIGKLVKLAGGYEAQTPAAVVYKATWPEEKIFRCTVGTLHKTVTENGLTKTSLIVVGGCLGDTYLRSLLYHPGFTTEFREATQ